jgi:hypothetical protein
MRVSSSAADLEPRVLASRCSSWIRKSSRLPISPPLVQAFDLVQVGGQAGQFLGHVDADGVGRGLGQRAVLGALRARHCAPGRGGHGLVPALQKARCCAPPVAAPAARPAGPGAQLAMAHAACWPGGRLRVRAGLQQQPPALSASGSRPRPGRSVTWPSRHQAAARRPRSGAWRRAARRDVVLQAGQPLQQPGDGSGTAGLERAFHGGAHFDLAALDVAPSAARAGPVRAAQLVGQAEARSRKRLLTERISSPDAWRRGRLGLGPAARCAVRWRSRSCCKLASDFPDGGCDSRDYPGSRMPESSSRLCQRSNPPRCRPTPWSVATAWSRSSLPAVSAWCIWPKTRRPAGGDQGIPAVVPGRARAGGVAPRSSPKSCRCTAWA